MKKLKVTAKKEKKKRALMGNCSISINKLDQLLIFTSNMSIRFLNFLMERLERFLVTNVNILSSEINKIFIQNFTEMNLYTYRAHTVWNRNILLPPVYLFIMDVTSGVNIAYHSRATIFVPIYLFNF